MEKSKRAPYLAQIKELERAGKVQFIAEHNIYAVLLEIDKLSPGMVLYPRPRKLNRLERKLSKKEQEALGIDLERNQVRIVHRYPDLWAAIRQRGRHIIQRLTERRITINKETEVIIAGESQQMKEMALILNDLTQRFLVEKVTPQLKENFSQGVFPIYQELEGAKDRFKPKAAQLLKQAAEGRTIEVPVRLAEVAAKILNRWVEILDIVKNCLWQAENWLLLCQTTETKISWAYQRLAKLTAELSEIRSPEPDRLKTIALEMGGILIYLNQEVRFNPYYQRARDPAVQNLVKAKEYAVKGDIKGIRNTGSQALAKLEAIVLGGKPTITEIKRRKRALAKG